MRDVAQDSAEWAGVQTRLNLPGTLVRVQSVHNQALSQLVSDRCKKISQSANAESKPLYVALRAPPETVAAKGLKTCMQGPSLPGTYDAANCHRLSQAAGGEGCSGSSELFQMVIASAVLGKMGVYGKESTLGVVASGFHSMQQLGTAQSPPRVYLRDSLQAFPSYIITYRMDKKS